MRKLNKDEQVIANNYPVVPINPHSKNPEHSIKVWIPKVIYPDFYVPANNQLIECKGYLRDKQWFALVKHMSPEDKSRYRVVFKNPNLETPWKGIDYGTWATMCGIQWTKHPHIKEEWLINGQ